MSEKDLQTQVFIRLNSRHDVRVFRNNVGMGFLGTVIAEERDPSGGQKLILGNARRIRFGLHEGSADLIGWKTIKITPDMVGQKIAVFISAEIKGPHGRMSEEQNNWMAQVLVAGGHAYEIRRVEQAEGI